jgi:hypothetical protein
MAVGEPTHVGRSIPVAVTSGTNGQPKQVKKS